MIRNWMPNIRLAVFDRPCALLYWVHVHSIGSLNVKCLGDGK